VTARVTVTRPGQYVITVDAPASDAGVTGSFSRVRITPHGETPVSVLVPAATRYLVTAHRAPVDLAFDPPVSSAAIRPANPVDALRGAERPRVRARLTLAIGDILTIRPLLRGTGKARREMLQALRLLTAWGFGVASRNLQGTPGLFDSPPGQLPAAVTEAAPRSAAPPRFVVALHLYYPALWPEFAARLGAIVTPFRLIVTTPLTDAAFHTAIRARFPDATIVVTPNRGRDIGPFVQLLHDGHFDRDDLICKLHGKQSAPAGHRALLGHVWRRADLLDLAGSEATVARILAMFTGDATIGMVGSPRFRLSSPSAERSDGWGRNRAATLALAGRLGIPPASFRLDYFAGSMFWVRRAVLDPVRKLGLTIADFPEESGARDGELQHAFERLFGALPALSGLRLAETRAERRETDPRLGLT
jgi:lipopolysaccharide biosynthesis protein